jgi:ClpA/ClpB-like protein
LVEVHVVWDPAVMMTTRLQSVLKAAEQNAIARGDDYLLPEHLLEAIVDETDGHARSILERSSDIDEIRSQLNGVWNSTTIGSLLMIEDGLPFDEYDQPYQVLTISQGLSARLQLLLGDDGEPRVWSPGHHTRGDIREWTHEPAPPEIAAAARRMQSEYG